jgi:ABC-type phosphate transport system substrate-binding protein
VGALGALSEASRGLSNPKGTPLRSISRRTLVGALVAVPALALAPAAGAVTLIGSGSSAAQPYMLKLFKGYSAIHRSVHFRYSPDGGNAGVQDVQQGRSQFAINTRPPLKSDSGTTYFKLFLDGLCIVDNPKNALSDISIGETKNIFLATDTNWSQVPGSNLATTIDPVGRNSAAGLYTFFQQAVLGGKTQALTIGGVACDAAHIKNESYPLFRYDWGVLPTSHPSVQVEKFFDWVRTSKAAGKIIGRAGAVPAFNKK